MARNTRQRVSVNDGKITPTTDGLRNAMTGLGGDSDKMLGTAFIFSEMPQAQLEAAYRSDWITRKGIDIPAFDSTREWRTWQAAPDDVTKIEAAEKKFQIQRKVMLTLQRARLYGGGALVIGVDDGVKMDQPLQIERVKPGSLKFVHSVSRYELTGGQLITDITSEFYGQPEYYTSNGQTQGIQTAQRIHPSRVVRFLGAPVLNNLTQPAGGWGDSVLQSVQEACIGAGLVTNSVAQLVAELKLDVIKVPGLTKNISTDNYETNLKKRFAFMTNAKSVYRTLVMDKDEEWERIEANFAGLPEVQKLYLLIASGAFDIPATRFLGQSPAGLTATGDSDMRNYYDRCSSHQKNEMQPDLKRLDDVLLRESGIDSVDEIDKVFYEWNPLWQLTDVEQSTMWKNKADIAQIDYNMGLISEVVLKKAREAQLVEDGVYPGFQQLVEEFDDDPELENEPEPPPPVDPALLPPPDPNNPNPDGPTPSPKESSGAPPPGTPSPRGGAKKGRSQSDAIRAMARRVRDASSNPRPLYVRRDVLNSKDIVAWAKSQGFKSVLDDLHVTVIYSRNAVDWLKVGNDDWSSDDKGNLTVKAGGPRVIEKFGEGAIVLAFSNSSLQYRNMMARENGASWDHEDYTPHITITYQPPLAFDVSSVQPYTGEIRLGPEIFEEIKADFNPSETNES